MSSQDIQQRAKVIKEIVKSYTAVRGAAALIEYANVL